MSSRPKISVCIGSYQGERYIALQLSSILAQLSTEDEVIIVDDCSSDKTCSEVSALLDPRVLLIQNAENRGILRTFETAISKATGDIVFLSDQDDLWLPGKVNLMLDTFVRDPDLMLLASDAILINEHGNEIGRSYYAQRGKFRSGFWPNLLKCKFLGCTMAFRSKLLVNALPFPHDIRVHHDIWLGCVNALIGGKTAYIENPLVAYRRHSTNVTGRVRFSSNKRFQMRLQLILALLALHKRI